MSGGNVGDLTLLLAALHMPSHHLQMIAYRMPWFTLIVGAAIIAAMCFLSLPEPARLTLTLVGGLLMLDGSLGLRVLPMMTPFASFPEDWLAIKRKFYFETLGVGRFLAAALGCAAFAVSATTFGDGDWQVWCLVALVVGWGCVWTLAALKAIRDVLAND
ncbi:MAG: hypothetical protein EON58_09960 [Alphaproteobacteria bacterium]|nr:MAG: hypothetical protein EON58_09960 [Alphaproteobacteria bacterium]